MLSYKDKTFCSGNGCSKFDGCDRALTEQVQHGAEKWWGGADAPIAQFTNPEELECYEAKEDE